jgi:hypothetical protein
MSKRMLA